MRRAGPGSEAVAVLAAAGPALLAWNAAPSPTFPNQALAIGLWGAFAMLLALRTPGRGVLRDSAPLLVALGLLAAAVLWSWGPGALPATLALSALGLLGSAAVMVASGAAQRRAASAIDVFALFCAAWVLTGLLSAAIGWVQVFSPAWADGTWIAQSPIPGRAVGNLRQPNHLSSLLMWAAIATVALVELRRLHAGAAALVLAVLMFAVVLTASRTGTLGAALLAMWGLVDRRLSTRARLLLLAAPVLYAASWLGMSAWASATAHTFGGAARWSEGTLSSSRFGVWANALEMVRQNPWAGVGFGQFNFAWTLTPFPNRPTAFFDHTHNLMLQFWVELGVPLGSMVLALLLWGLWQAARSARWRGGEEGAAQRAAVMMVAMIGLHSLLEYPLWYAYFLLPTAWAWGFALGRPGLRLAAGVSPMLLAGGMAMMAGAALAAIDFGRVAAIYMAPRVATVLTERVAEGRDSVLFGHHADFVAATAGIPGADETNAFERATHFVLDTRLMTAWAKQLAREGRIDEARHVADRLREFKAKAPAARKFLAACEGVSQAASGAAPTSDAASAPFQCSPPSRAVGWREFLAD